MSSNPSTNPEPVHVVIENHSKVLFDLFKHLTTLSLVVIGLFLALSERVNASGREGNAIVGTTVFTFGISFLLWFSGMIYLGMRGYSLYVIEKVLLIAAGIFGAICFLFGLLIFSLVVVMGFNLIEAFGAKG